MKTVIVILLSVCTVVSTAQIKPANTNRNNPYEKTSSSGTGAGTGSGLPGIAQNDAANAIKDLLITGVTSGVKIVSKQDGYFKNQFIKIPFPPQAVTMEKTLRQVGMGALCDNIILSCNRAAEKAATEATPIFIGAIKQLTITDAVNIISNKQTDAATRFLERTTTEPLVKSFKGPIKTALDATYATKYWGQAFTYYNKIPFVRKVNTDLPDFVTRKAISGLFYMVAKEEEKIRKDPKARTTDLLKKVFQGLF